MSRKRLILGAVAMYNGSHAFHGVWRHPDAAKQREFETLPSWVELAKTLERGRSDFLFFADVIGAYDVYGGDWSATAREGAQFPSNDPLVLSAALAAVTENLGYAITSSVFYQNPYAFARQLSTLDHLSGGRIAWNIVTSVIENGAKNVGLEGLPEHDERYAWAGEYVDAVLKLWEKSWDDDALVRDPASGVFVDPSKIREIGHVGERFRIKGPHQVPPSPQRTPVLIQAGGSPIGREFAAKNAELAFVVANNPQLARETIRDVRFRVVAAGRAAEDLKFFTGLSTVVGSTETEAKALNAELDEWIREEGLLTMLSGHMQTDFADLDLDKPLADFSTGGMQGFLQDIRASVPPEEQHRLTYRDVFRTFTGLRVVGTPEQIADRFEEWQDAGIDGIGLLEVIRPQTFDDFVDHVVPELQKRGLMQTEYAPGTLREKLFDRGPSLPATHRAHGLPVYDSRDVPVGA